MHQLIDDWHEKYTNKNLHINQVLILAHRNTDVSKLNQIARARRILSGEISQGIVINQDKKDFYLSEGDRLIFLKNDHELGVKNGQFGTVMILEKNESGKAKKIFVKLDNGKIVGFVLEKYPHFNYGYSATIHKTQGVTLDHSFIYLSGKYWNRNLLYVAGSRHKKSMEIYVNQKSYPDLRTLYREIGKDGLKDSVIDYPLNFSKRRGLGEENLYLRVKKHLLDRLIKMRDFIKAKSYILKVEKKYRADSQLKNNIQEPESRHSYQDAAIGRITTKLEKLISNFEQAKKEKSHYKAYKAKREMEYAVKKISRNKNLYQKVKSNNILLQKKFDQYLESEYEL